MRPTLQRNPILGRFPIRAISVNSDYLMCVSDENTGISAIGSQTPGLGSNGRPWQNRLDFPLRRRIGRRYYPFLHDCETNL